VLFEEFRAGNRRASRHSQCGEGRFKAIAFTVILVLGIYVAFKLVPIYMAEYQLNDKMQEEARYAVVNRYSEDKIKDEIMKEVADLEIPVKREDITVSSTNRVVKIAIDYTVPVDLLFYHLDLHFTPSSENKSLF
jgi:cell division protein FtsL